MTNLIRCPKCGAVHPRRKPISRRALVIGQARREQIVSFVGRYWAEFHQAPSLREIGRGVGLHERSVRRHLERLESDGQIRRVPGMVRSVEVVS